MPTSPYSTVYAFGDSLSDAGNAYLLSISSEASVLGFSPTPVSPPYKQISYSDVAADVFSNGPVWTQDLSQALGLGTLAPSGVGATADTLQSALTAVTGSSIEASIAVAAIEAADGIFGPDPYLPVVAGASGGTDYAIGGAVTGITTENADPTIALYDLDAQLTTFRHDEPTPLANALATVSIGGNDIFDLVEDVNFATLYGTGTTLANVGATQAGMDIAQSVSLEAGFLGSLASDGVDNIVVMNAPDIGPTPEITARGATIAADATVLSEYYDNLLAADVAALNSATVHITIADAFTLIDSAVADPAAYKLQNVTSPVYSGSFSSFTPADLVSADPATQNTYLFFDKEHPTETGQAALTDTALRALGVACFAAGTRILTAIGEVPVEQLRIGARVLLARGGTAPITWIGHSHVDCARHPRPREVWPIRVHAGAFGQGLPRRDLLLSPDHAVFFGGGAANGAADILIPVRYLINGATVTQSPCRRMHYFHLELPVHAVILAEGLTTESYLDTGNRGLFADPGEEKRTSGAAHALRRPAGTACAPTAATVPQAGAATRSHP
jgi:phospholipase/lecithinase/hemolysin